MTTNDSIKKVISEIKSELNAFYPLEEIDSFVHLIFEEVLGYSRTQLLLLKDENINPQKIAEINKIVEELKEYKPIQYILGKTTFYDLPFRVKPEALIPRPETEELVDWIISNNRSKNSTILDLGTGSGCIAISLAKNLLESKVYAADISEKALKLAKSNGEQNKVEVNFLQLDILDPQVDFMNKLDIIVSNPPYVTESEKTLMNKNVLDFEPELALFVPNEDPLRFYRAIIKFALSYLNKRGQIYFEINEAYGNEIVVLLEESGFSDIILKKDINGKDRMIKAILK